MIYFRLLCYKLFRLVHNRHFVKNPEAMIPMSESLRVSIARSLDKEGHLKALERWAAVRMSAVLKRDGVVLVAGCPKHGKTYVANLLAVKLGMTFANTSDLIYAVAAETNPKIMSVNKDQKRSVLIGIGDRLCRDNPSAILDTLSSRGFRIIAGVRKLKELNKFSSTTPVFVIWVDRPHHATVQDNTTLKPEHCDFILTNDEMVHKKIDGLCSELERVK